MRDVSGRQAATIAAALLVALAAGFMAAWVLSQATADNGPKAFVVLENAKKACNPNKPQCHTVTSTTTITQGTTTITQPTSTVTTQPTSTTTPTPTPTPTAAIKWGAHVKGSQYGLGNPPWDMNAQTTFETHAGKKASLMPIGANWGSTTPNFQPTPMTTIRSHGSIPFFSWGPLNGAYGSSQPTYKLSTIYGGAHDAYITKFAQDAKAWGHPFFLRFAWEMNGTWYPWSEQANGNAAGDYVKAWRHVWTIFHNVGATNANFTWCPNIVYPGTTPLPGLYPGDAYVDWLCLDGYNKDATSRSFYNLIKPKYDQLVALSSKPIVIAETASKDSAYPAGTKAAWITDAFKQVPASFPRIRAVIWFNWNTDGDFVIESTAGATTAFRNAIASSAYAANTFGAITGPKIAP